MRRQCTHYDFIVMSYYGLHHQYFGLNSIHMYNSLWIWINIKRDGGQILPIRIPPIPRYFVLDFCFIIAAVMYEPRCTGRLCTEIFQYRSIMLANICLSQYIELGICWALVYLYPLNMFNISLLGISIFFIPDPLIVLKKIYSLCNFPPFTHAYRHRKMGHHRGR